MVERPGGPLVAATSDARTTGRSDARTTGRRRLQSNRVSSCRSTWSVVWQRPQGDDEHQSQSPELRRGKTLDNLGNGHHGKADDGITGKTIWIYDPGA